MGVLDLSDAVVLKHQLLIYFLTIVHSRSSSIESTLLSLFRFQLRNNIPCYIEDISCGRRCEKPLFCGHKCPKTCHKVSSQTSDNINCCTRSTVYDFAYLFQSQFLILQNSFGSAAFTIQRIKVILFLKATDMFMFVYFHQILFTMNYNKINENNRNKTMKEKITPIDDDGAKMHCSLANSVLAP